MGVRVFVGVRVLVGVKVRVKVGVQVATWNPVAVGIIVEVERKPGCVACGVSVMPEGPGVHVSGNLNGVFVYVGRINAEGKVGGGKGFKPPYGFEYMLITTRSTIAVANNNSMLKISHFEIFIKFTLPFKVSPPCQELTLSVYPRFQKCQAVQIILELTKL